MSREGLQELVVGLYWETQQYERSPTQLSTPEKERDCPERAHRLGWRTQFITFNINVNSFK